jgi:hypothetical protein
MILKSSQYRWVKDGAVQDRSGGTFLQEHTYAVVGEVWDSRGSRFWPRMVVLIF